MLTDDKKGDIERGHQIILHITIKIVKQFAVYVVKIFTHNNPVFLWFGRNNVYDLLINVVPQ
jgi:hypothetical protein